MKIFALADFHGATEILEKLASKIKETSPDLIVFAGDIVKGHARGNEWLKAKSESRPPQKDLPEIKNEEKEDLELYRKFYFFLNQFQIPVAAVPGNMDAPKERYFKIALESETTYNNIKFVHGKQFKFGRSFVISGFGGEIVEKESEDYFVQIYPHWEAEFALSDLNYTEQDRILIFHMPPVSEVDLDQGKHIGSEAMNNLIKTYRPKFVFCGHAHRSPASAKIADSLVINPGALKLGNCAVLDTVNQKVDFVHL